MGRLPQIPTLIVVLMLIPFAGAFAQNFDGQAALCEGGAADASIGACTWLLRSGELSQESYANAYFNRGNSYAALGRFDRAIEDYDEALRLSPTFASAYTNKGNALGSLGRFEEAIRLFDRAIDLDPSAAPAFYNRGRAYFGLGAHGRAIQDLDVALHLDPAYVDALRGRAQSNVRLGRFERAVRDYDDALALAPTNPRILNALAWLLATRPSVRDPARAIVLARKAVMLEEKASRWDTLGAAFVAAGRTEEALRAYNTALGLDAAYREEVADWLAANGYASGPTAGEDGRSLGEAMAACVRAGCQLGVE